MAGLLLDEPRNQVAWQSCRQLIHDLAGLVFAHFKMHGVLHLVRQVQVLGQHARIEQFFAEPDQGIRMVIYVSEQDALVQQVTSGMGQLGELFLQLGVNLPGMVNVHHQHGFQPGPVYPFNQS